MTQLEEMLQDINEMLLVIEILTPKDSMGSDVIKKWREKYAQ